MNVYHADAEYARIGRLLRRARNGFLPYEGEKELRALLARHDADAAAMPWGDLIEYGAAVYGFFLIFEESGVEA